MSLGSLFDVTNKILEQITISLNDFISSENLFKDQGVEILSLSDVKLERQHLGEYFLSNLRGDGRTG